jgi:transposase InsO family protein
LEGTELLFEALIDTGAQESCISKRLAESAQLPIVAGAEEGFVMADQRAGSVPSLGRVENLSLTFFFLQYAASPVEVTHSFEILDMSHEQHDVIVGVDLIPSLFPLGVPIDFIRQADGEARTDGRIRSIRAGTGDVASSLSDTPVTSAASSVARTVGVLGDSMPLQADDPRLMPGLRALQEQIHSEGAGDPPQQDQPTRMLLETAPSLEQEYAAKRAQLLEELQPVLEINVQITGFCSLPESVVQLHVDPAKKSKLFRKQYPIAAALIPLVREVLQRWLAEGRIESAEQNCEYNNPLLVVPKKDDDGKLTAIRVVLDVRLLNDALLVTDSFPLPSIGEILAQYKNCIIFGEFDLREAYLQFLLHPDSRKYTAFTFEGKQYQFVGCPFGIKSLPGIFQRVMSAVIRGELDRFVRPYLDNLPFGSRDWAEHLVMSKAILQRLNECNLRVKPNVKLGYSSLRVLGHQVSAAGIGLDPDKLAVVKEWQPPKTGDDMARFLGFIGFLSGNVRHFAELTAPLHAVKHEKVVPYDAQPQLLEHFHATKAAVLRAPTLQFPDLQRAFHLACDASNTGVGGVLFQPKRDDEYITKDNIVALFSHKLIESEQKYPAYRKELLAVKMGLQRFHMYLWGRLDTVVITDHKPLTFIRTSPLLSPALEQWCDVIQNYSFTIRHRPGVMHVMPDQLSRMFAAAYENTPAWGVRANALMTADAAEHDAMVLETIRADFGSWLAKMRKTPAVRKRAGLSVVRKQPSDDAVGGQPPDVRKAPPQVVKKVSTHVRPELLPTPLQSTLAASSEGEGLRDAANKAEAQGESKKKETHEREAEHAERLLIVELERRGKRAAPKQERPALINKFHLAGHFGRDAIFNKMYSKGYWWPNMRRDIDEQLSNCDACIRYVVTKKGFHPASSVTALLPGDHWQMDCATHMPESSDGHTAMLIVVDVCTGLLLCCEPLVTPSAEEVAQKLLKVIQVLGPPKILQSDNGPEFSNDTIRALVRLMGVQHRLIAPYNPRADGKVERTIGTVSLMVKKLLHGTTRHWPLFLPFAQLHYNDKISSLTGSTPFALFFARPMNAFVDHTQTPAVQVERHIDLDSWREHQEKILSLVYPAIAERVGSLKDAMVLRLNKYRRLLTESIPTGAVVMVRDPHRTTKQEPAYIGPYTVVRRTQNGTYVLKDQLNDLFDRHVPVDQLKLISKAPSAKAAAAHAEQKREVQESEATESAASADQAQPTDRDIYEVSHVADHRGSPGQYEFLTYWKGYAEPTWVAEEKFIDHACITKYWKNRKMQRNMPQALQQPTRLD